MAYSVEFAAALDADLEALAHSDASAAHLWTELIDAIYDVPAVARELLVASGYRPRQPRFDTVPVGVLLRRGYNISRIKLYRPDGSAHRHRLLFALDHSRPPQATIWLLGLMERSADYEPDHPLLQRACADYDQLGIPRVPRG